jgi:hypothetical protein
MRDRDVWERHACAPATPNIATPPRAGVNEAPDPKSAFAVLLHTDKRPVRICRNRQRA